MRVLVSPAFNMHASIPEGATPPRMTSPRFLSEARELASIYRTLAPWELAERLDVKQDRAIEMFDRWQSFPLTDDQADSNLGLPALLAYDGIQYTYMHARDFSLDDWAVAGEKVRIISPAYGVLAATDEMHAHRLRLPHTIPGLEQTVLSFWKDRIISSLLEEDDEFILLTSKEYTDVIRAGLEAGGAKLTIPDFKIHVKGQLMTQSTYAKMARGSMVSYIVREGIETPQAMEGFTWNGFAIDDGLSEPDAPVFVRAE